MLSKWESHMRGAGFSPTTIDLYTGVINELLAFVDELNPEAIDRYLEDQLNRNQRSTVNTKLMVIRSFIGWAESRGHVEGVLEHLPEKIKAPKSQPYVPERKEIADLLGALRAKHRLAVLTMADAGLRIHEALKLQARDVDLSRGLIQVVGKGHKARLVPITTDRLRVALAQRLETCNAADYLVPGRSGTRMTTSNLRKVLTAASERAGVKRVTPHALRHSFAAHSARSLVPTKTIQKVLGHSSLSVTDRYLSSLEDGEQARAAYQGAFEE